MGDLAENMQRLVVLPQKLFGAFPEQLHCETHLYSPAARKACRKMWYGLCLGVGLLAWWTPCAVKIEFLRRSGGGRQAALPVSRPDVIGYSRT